MSAAVFSFVGMVPDALASAPTGPELCARLAAVRPDAVTDEQLLELLAAQWRQLSYQQAQVWAVMAEIGRRDPMPNLSGAAAWTPEQVFESAVDEIRAELRLTRRAARRELTRAEAVAALPRVAAALAAGALDRGRAIVLADGCLDLTEAQTATLLDEVLPDAAAVTAPGLADRVRRVAIALDPDWAERRYRQALEERRVIGYLHPDGSATVSGQYLPAGQAAAACARVDALAGAAKRAGAAAKLDHLRAELFLGLLDGRFHDMTEVAITDALLQQFPSAAEHSCTAEEGAWRGVELRVGLGTLLGRDEQPGEIAGWGAVTASVARDIAARQRTAEWRYAIVDDDGELLFDGITRHRPTRGESDQPQAVGGIVELHVPLTLLTDGELAARHPDWSGVLADLAGQYDRRRPIDQDPAARFAGRRLRRRSQLRYRTCTFPGCRRPASACDQDHRRDHSRGGRTDEDNLAPGCRHDHMNKTARGWRLIRSDEGTFVWVSPLGRRHLVHPAPVAPPLPAPIPRRQPGPEHEASRAPESDPDPPPL